ncbi:MAG: glycosyltransferase family 4 protein [Lachnospiraceae bacterium]|nr:glycosyltransferase family 4 protein [Lachnospiraceae bacterium]MBQ8947863.1 glycosyltransferase family 4 protein [Lachnospiraceae bacterium]
MKIVFVTFEFVTEKVKGGGLASYLANISSILADAGHSVTIITLSHVNDSFEWKNRIRVERVCVPPLLIGKGRVWLSLINQSRYLNRRLRKLIRSGQHFDIVQYPNTNAVGLFRTGIPSVVRISNDSLLWRNSNIEGFDVDKAYKCETVQDKLEDIALKKADRVFGPSSRIAGIISTRTGRKIDIVESPYIQFDDDPDFVSDYLNLIKDKKYFLTFGQLSRMKGIQVIGESIYRLLDTHQEYYYIFSGPDRSIVSDGQYITCMEYISENAKEYADRIIYLGSLPRQDLYPVIRAAKMVILTSRIDNMPNTCLEAMYLKKPVIGTNGAGFEQLITDGVNGFLIGRDSADDLVKTADRIINMSDEELNIIGEKAFERIRQMKPKDTLDKTLGIYSEVLSK